MSSAKSPHAKESYLYLPKAYIAPINPTPSSISPIPNARTSILSRFESYHGRPTYRVRIVYESGTDARDSEHTEGEEDTRVTVEEVDLSAILDYVSALELERFENAEFKREKEAQIRAEAQKAERKTSRRSRSLKAQAATVRPTVQVVITRKPPAQIYDDEGEDASPENTGASLIRRSVEKGSNSVADSEADSGKEQNELSVPPSGFKTSKFMTTSALPLKSHSKHNREVRASESTTSTTSISSPARQLRADSGLNHSRRATSSASMEPAAKPDHHQNKRLRISKSSSFTSEPSLSRATSHNRFDHAHKGNTRDVDHIEHIAADAEASEIEDQLSMR